MSTTHVPSKETQMARLADLLEEAIDDANILSALDYELLRLRSELDRVFRAPVAQDGS